MHSTSQSYYILLCTQQILQHQLNKLHKHIARKPENQKEFER